MKLRIVPDRADSLGDSTCDAIFDYKEDPDYVLQKVNEMLSQKGAGWEFVLQEASTTSDSYFVDLVPKAK